MWRAVSALSAISSCFSLEQHRAVAASSYQNLQIQIFDISPVMAEKQNDLMHEEVWDDSALIDSWNEALDEYKKYHSIHAKGGSIQDLNVKNGTGTSIKAEPRDNASVGLVDDTQAEGQNEDSETKTDEAVSSYRTPHTAQPGSQPAQGQGGLPSFPLQVVLGAVQDENLKKLLMSWYYAGYYTGLYEGQQQPKQNQ
ncbi:hypothetical protein G7046_g6829 [Stylonectria norvegica]|nr:hypothetical protein G7046_g6829 [Stylonectria norvegica]